MSNIIQRKSVFNMAQGNPNKVNAIVDEIVENNNVFKLKSPIEQDKEKDSIAQSINSAISVLNEVGKELVLQELSVDPDEKFKGFIDSVGNIDISGLTQMTATIVKEKIIEAEREGVDLRQGQPVFKDNTKALLVGGVLTVAVISDMVNKYENLSDTEKGFLFQEDIYMSMSDDDRKKLDDSVYNEVNKKNLSEEDKKRVEENYRKNQINYGYIKIAKEHPEFTYEEIVLEFMKTYPQFSENEVREQLKQYYNPEKHAEENIYAAKQNSRQNTIDNKIIGTLHDYNELVKLGKIKEAEKLLLSHKDWIPEIDKIYLQMKEEGKFTRWSEKRYENDKNNYSTQKEEIQNLKDKITNEEKEKYKQEKEDIFTQQFKGENAITDAIQNEIEQLPSALAKANFSQEDTLEAMKQYRDYISNYSEIPEEVADNIKKLDSDDIVLNIQDDFNSLKGDGQINSNVHQILNILAQVNYGSSMQQILTNSEVREQFLAQFDKVIEQGINLDQDVKLDGELAQIFSQYFKDNAEEMDISAIEEQKEQVTDEQVKQEEPKEMFSFIDSEYLKQDSIEGLLPRNGENSQSLQDDKKAIFYSQGKEGAIVMYFEFLKQYERLRGSAGDKALEQYANYKNRTIELSDEQVQLLQGQLKQITQMRETKDFDEFMGDKLYLKLNGIDTEQDRQAAEEWRASHPGTRMDYNYANSWTNSAISPDRIDVVSLQSKDGKDVRTSQKDLIKYFLSQTSIDKIEELGVNDTTLENIRKYYQEHSAEIAQMGEEYSVVTQNIQEFEQSRESKETEKQSETRETEITAPEIEKHEENLPAKQDNSFLGKIKRVFANMKDMKNKDNSKGFFARLGASIQTVFGNKKDEFDEKQDENITLNSTQMKEQTREDSKQTNYLTQHFEVNEKQAVQDLKKKQDSKDKDSQLSQDDQEFGNL